MKYMSSEHIISIRGIYVTHHLGRRVGTKLLMSFGWLKKARWSEEVGG
jgi:hypothetical protein